MKNRTLKVTALCMALMLGAAGCGKAAEPASQPEESLTPVQTEADGAAQDSVAQDGAQSYDIAVVSSGIYHQFGMAVKTGMEAAAEEFHVNMSFDGPETDAEIDKQVDMLKVAIDKKPDAIVLNAIDEAAMNSELERAKELGIPVITCVNGVSSEVPEAFVYAGDEASAGAMAADKMAEALGEAGGQVGLVCADQNSNWSVGRRDGFVNRCKEAYPNIEVVDVQYSGGDHLKATDCTKAIIQAYPDLKGLFGNGEGNMVGIINAVNELNADGKYTIVGFDSGKIQLDAIKNGMIIGAVTQDPYGMGYNGIKAAVDYLNGEEVNPLIDTGFYWYDTTNMEDENIQRMIYE